MQSCICTSGRRGCNHALTWMLPHLRSWFNLWTHGTITSSQNKTSSWLLGVCVAESTRVYIYFISIPSWVRVAMVTQEDEDNWMGVSDITVLCLTLFSFILHLCTCEQLDWIHRCICFKSVFILMCVKWRVTDAAAAGVGVDATTLTFVDAWKQQRSWSCDRELKVLS